MTTLCYVCQRNPKRMNSRIAQCSHVECPHRPWLDVITPADIAMMRRESEAQDQMFDDLQPSKRQSEKAEKREAKCRNCGSTDVRWRVQGGRWVLFSMQPGFEHRCGMDEIAKDFD
jgi:hypothetical protein